MSHSSWNCFNFSLMKWVICIKNIGMEKTLVWGSLILWILKIVQLCKSVRQVHWNKGAWHTYGLWNSRTSVDHTYETFIEERKNYIILHSDICSKLYEDAFPALQPSHVIYCCCFCASVCILHTFSSPRFLSCQLVVVEDCKFIFSSHFCTH